MTSLKNKVKDAADKAKTSIKSTGKKDDAAPGDAEDITRGDVAAGATGVSGVKGGTRADDKPGTVSEDTTRGDVAAGATEVSRKRRAEGEKLRRA
jgi:hypothetical protein